MAQAQQQQPQQQVVGVNNEEFQKKLTGHILKFKFNKGFNACSKQLRAEAPLNFLPVHDGHTVFQFQKSYHRLCKHSGQITGQDAQFIYKRVLNYLALFATKNLYPTGNLYDYVYITDDLSFCTLHVCYTSTQEPVDDIQIQQFAKQLGISIDNSTQDYKHRVFDLKWTNDPVAQKGVEVKDCRNLEDLEKAVLNLEPFILFNGKVMTPQLIYHKIQGKLAQKQKEGDQDLVVALIGLHMMNFAAFPSLQFVPTEMLSVKDQTELDMSISQIAAFAQLSSLSENFLQCTILRAVLGMAPYQIERKGLRKFAFNCDTFDFTQQIDMTNPILSKDDQTKIMQHIIDQCAQLPEAYAVRVREYLFHLYKIEIVTDQKEPLIADGIILKIKGSWQVDINQKSLQNFVHLIMDPFNHE